MASVRKSVRVAEQQEGITGRAGGLTPENPIALPRKSWFRGICSLSDLPDDGGSAEEFSQNSTSWQVSYRIRQKLLEFLDYDS